VRYRGFGLWLLLMVPFVRGAVPGDQAAAASTSTEAPAPSSDASTLAFLLIGLGLVGFGCRRTFRNGETRPRLRKAPHPGEDGVRDGARLFDNNRVRGVRDPHHRDTAGSEFVH
jgi:MYXO-CTERM domain-containing protein